MISVYVAQRHCQTGQQMLHQVRMGTGLGLLACRVVFQAGSRSPDAGCLRPDQGFRDLIPATYSSLRNPATFGDFVPIDPGELRNLADLAIAPVSLQIQEVGRKDAEVADYLAATRTVKEMIRSMAFWIEERRAASGTSSIRNHPERHANPRVETELMLFRKWTQQKGLCGLCHRPIPVPCQRGMLQLSADRIDSGLNAYSDDNVHLTHLGCNYAKNQFSVDDFEDWLQLVRGGEV